MWLTLTWAPGCNWRRLQSVLAEKLTIEALFHCDKTELLKLGFKPQTIPALKNPNQKLIEQHLQWAHTEGNHLISIEDRRYPPLLQETYDPPLVLFVKGNPELLTQPQIAMVGSRKPTPAGVETAKDFAYALSQAGAVITSGLAHGIDRASHEGALRHNGKTIAVMGTGVDVIYPTRNSALATKIMETGALVSELPLGTAPQKHHFPKRNRIIAAMSLGTVVVEAMTKSGSLISARLAMENGREVFAVPGSIYNPQAHGCHELIKSGAKLTENVEDIGEELPQFIKTPHATKSENNFQLGLDATDMNLLECIGHEISSLDSLSSRSQLSFSALTTHLLNLELKGLISSVPGGYIRVS